MPVKTVCIGLIGSGFMGRAHANAYLKAPRFFDLPVEPVMHTVAARRANELRQFATRWGWRHWTTRWRQLIEDPGVEMVDIGTPNHAHCSQAIAAIEAGKHVACEKPLAGTLAEARQMTQASQSAAGVKTFVWFNYRRCPAVALAHQLVRDGRLGRLYHIRAAYLQDWAGPDTPLSWRFQRRLAGSGAHGDLNAHMIDLARFISGDEILEVVGAIEKTFIPWRDRVGVHASSGQTPPKGRSNVDDTVLFLARMSSGAVASFEASRLSTGDKNRNRIEVHGEHGAVRFDLERMNELQWYDATVEPRLQGWTTINVTRGRDHHPYAGAWWPDAHILGYEHTFVNQVADMMGLLADRPPVVPMPDFADAFETQRVLHAAIESARHRSPVRISQLL